MKKLLSAVIFGFLGIGCVQFPPPVLAESQVIPQFRGLHNAENSMLINDDEAQDLRNVDMTDSGLGVKKRDGYDQYKTIGTSTWAVRGGYYFRDTSANDNIIHSNNQSIFKSVTGGNYTAFVTTDTAGSYYDFTDSRGLLWRATDNRDEILSYNGSAVTYYPSHPKGDQIEVLPDRLAISGTTANINRIHFSKKADFTTFTTGSDEADPYTEDVGLPGQKINAIKVGCGDSLLGWTRDTMFQYTGDSQRNGHIDQISNTIGTVQPNSIIQDYGITYWQSPDKHFYAYDCNVITKLSQKLDVSNFSGGESKLWEQTSQTDWQAGTLTNDLNATLSVGDISMSTWTDTDTTAANFALGTLTQVTTSTVSGAVYLSTTNTNVLNNDFETAFCTNWTCSGTTDTSLRSPYSGSLHMRAGDAVVTCGNTPNVTGQYPKAEIKRTSDNVLVASTTISHTGAYSQFSISGITAGINVYLLFTHPGGGTTQSDNFLSSGSPITFYSKWVEELSGGDCIYERYVDLVEGGRSTIYDGNIVSRNFDTTISSPAWLSSTAAWTTNSHTITAQTQTSSDGSSWDSLVSWTTGSAPTSAYKRYVRYKISIATATAGTALPYIDDATLAARSSTGTFVSQAKNIGSNATSFRNFTATDNNSGGTISHFIRTATTEAGLSSASYVALTKDAQITASINPWVQVKTTFTITAATQTPTLSNFIVNWDEGTIVRVFGSVDKNHRLMWTLAENGSSTPNATYIYDPRFASWLKYSVPFQSPARVGDSIYFGGVSTGVVYNWPSGDNDAGSGITAYWKSKDFTGGDPFVEKNFLRYSFLGQTNAGSNLDITYTINTTSTVTRNYSLTDPGSVTIRRINNSFPSGKFGTFINFKFGNDDANAPFELYGFKYDYTFQPWRVLQ